MSFKYHFHIFRSLLRAADTLVHGLIGGFSYWVTCIMCPELLLRVSDLCRKCHPTPQLQHGALLNSSVLSFAVPFLLACTVDVDHIFYDIFQLIIVSIGMVVV